jgi:LPS export ABC transporter permease LptG/LPS export ABC transporter permease LptF
VRTLDRYLIREIVPPFLIALGVYTFILDVMPLLDAASEFLAKGVPPATIARLLLLLLPQALGLTIPMAFLTGLLMALGRISGDREAMAMLACGVSPMRLLRPALVAAAGAGLLTLYVMVWLLPDCNQRYNDIGWKLLTERTEQEVKAGQFYEGFPGKVLFIQSSNPIEGWRGVFMADTSRAGPPSVAMAERGRLFLNREQQQVVLSLTQALEYAPGADERVYDTSRTVSTAPLVFAIAASDVFSPVAHGFPEMSMTELRASIAAEQAAGGSARTQYLYFQQMFSFPVACLVFGLLALPIGLHTRREGKLGGMVTGLAVVFLYYALMKIGESMAKANLLPPIWQRWVPNLVLIPVAIAGLWWRMHSGVRTGGAWLSWLVPRRRALTRPVPAADTASAAPAPSRAWLGLRTLDRYIGGVYLRVAALALFGLLALNYFGAVIDMSGHVAKHEATMALVGRYLWYATPQFVTWLVPMVSLVTVLATIGGLTRTNELTVMRACGISLYRAAWPLLAFGLVWSTVLFGVQETVLARANRRASDLRDEIRTGAPVQRVSINNDHWLAGTDGRIYYYLGFETRGVPKLTGLSIFESTPGPYRLRAHVYAAGVEYRDGAWHAREGWVQQFNGAESSREAFRERVLDLPSPDHFGASRVDTNTLNFGQLRRQIERLDEGGYNVAAQKVKLHAKIAFPLVGVVMTVLGIPFGVTTGRRGALYGVGLAIILAFTYWLIAYIFVALGSAGMLPPVLAAWAANILFLSAATYLILTVRT